MSTLSQFIGGLRIGMIMPSAVNLETITNGEFLACDGSDRLRSAVSSAYSAVLPAGKFTATSRTLAATTATAALATGGTNFLAAGAAGTTALQGSATGATGTWTLAPTTPASTQVNCIIHTGVRYIIGVSGSAQPLVVTEAGVTASSACTVTTGATTSTLRQSLAYASSLGLTAFIPDAAGTTVYTLADGATAWTSRTLPSSQSKTCMCWTGTYFVIFTTTPGLIQYSTDGVTWSETYLANLPAATNTYSCASNGSGTIVYVNGSSAAGRGSVHVSKDHGFTWRRIELPMEMHFMAHSYVFAETYASLVSYVNSKFFLAFNVSGAPALAVSLTGESFCIEPVGKRGVANLNVQNIVYKSAVYCMTVPGDTAAMTATEDTTYFRTPMDVHTMVSGQAQIPLAFQHYIKVK